MFGEAHFNEAVFVFTTSQQIVHFGVLETDNVG
jgi:hypothetical protein